MPNEVTDNGEEWVVDSNLDGQSVTVGLYNQVNDSLDDTSTESDITTEPTGSAYSRQSSSVTTSADVVGDSYGFENDSTLTFDTSDSSQTVDHVFILGNVPSISGDELVAIAALDSTRNLEDFTEIKIEVGQLTLVAE
jgi:hypothetical protein